VSRQLIKYFIILAIFGLLAWVVQHDWFAELTDSSEVRNLLQQNGLVGYFIALLVASLFTAVGGPRQIVSFAAGFSLGCVYGTLAALLATSLGCVISYFVAHTLLRPMLQKRFQGSLTRVSSWLTQRTFRKLLMIRLLPVGSNVVTNLLAGSIGVNPLKFFLSSVLGYIPQTLIFAMAGTGIAVANSWQLVISGVLFVAASVLGMHLYRDRANRNPITELETQ
jgi:uncharacterized membrane protein YdjX (TVP38/TMEM64 family)